MEARIGLERGSLDAPASGTESSGNWPFKLITQDRYAKLPEHVRGIAEGRVLAIIEEWEASGVKSSSSERVA